MTISREQLLLDAKPGEMREIDFFLKEFKFYVNSFHTYCPGEPERSVNSIVRNI